MVFLFPFVGKGLPEGVEKKDPLEYRLLGVKYGKMNCSKEGTTRLSGWTQFLQEKC